MTRPDFFPEHDDADADPAFDVILRAALRACPQPMAPSNLAARAMEIARDQSRQEARRHAEGLSRQRRWLGLCSAAAAMLIAAILAVAAQRLWTRGDITALTTSTSTASSISTDADASTSASSADAASVAASSSQTSSTATSTSAASTTDSSTSSSSTSSIAGAVGIVFLAELLVVGLVLMTITRSNSLSPVGNEIVMGMW
jgi:cobalamin biosynthesis Mg chelatase CobN